MAKKTAQPVGASSSEVSKSSLIKDILAATPDRSPKDIADELVSQGIPTTPNYVSTIKTNLKNQTKAPKKRGKAKKAASKAPKAQKTAPQAENAAPQAAVAAPQAVSDADISFDQLRMAKEMARQLGGAEKAKEVLSALMQLAE